MWSEKTYQSHSIQSCVTWNLGMFELKGSLFLPPVSIVLFLRADRKTAHKKYNNEKCIYLFWIYCIKASQKYCIEVRWLSFCSLNKPCSYLQQMLLYDATIWKRGSESATGREQVQRGVKEHERRGKRVVSEVWPQFKGSLSSADITASCQRAKTGSKWLIQCFSFFFLSSFPQTW